MVLFQIGLSEKFFLRRGYFYGKLKYISSEPGRDVREEFQVEEMAFVKVQMGIGLANCKNSRLPGVTGEEWVTGDG